MNGDKLMANFFNSVKGTRSDLSLFIFLDMLFKTSAENMMGDVVVEFLKS